MPKKKRQPSERKQIWDKLRSQLAEAQATIAAQALRIDEMMTAVSKAHSELSTAAEHIAAQQAEVAKRDSEVAKLRAQWTAPKVNGGPAITIGDVEPSGMIGWECGGAKGKSSDRDSALFDAAHSWFLRQEGKAIQRLAEAEAKPKG